MVTVTGRGEYWLTSHPMLITLRNEQEKETSKKTYRFILANGQEKICFISESKFNFTKDVALGRFRMYEVKNEQTFKNGMHLELSEGAGKWNCYMLPHGLPNKGYLEKSVHITTECITK